MQIIQDRYQDQGFTFIAVNLQESQEEVMAFKNELAFDFPVWMDPTGVIAGEYGIQSIPTTYLINGKGEVVGRIIGSIDWTEAGVVQVIETLLSKLEA
jgi:thioredoxin-related protein